MLLFYPLCVTRIVPARFPEARLRPVLPKWEKAFHASRAVCAEKGLVIRRFSW